MRMTFEFSECYALRGRQEREGGKREEGKERRRGGDGKEKIREGKVDLQVRAKLERALEREAAGSLVSFRPGAASARSPGKLRGRPLLRASASLRTAGFSRPGSTMSAPAGVESPMQSKEARSIFVQQSSNWTDFSFPSA